VGQRLKQRPLGARRSRAERYLVFTIAAFAVTVAGVRWYLDLAGYPTIGGGGLHVAHVLWGGLALFIAALLPLLYVGRRALLISALLAGVGVGLFIDEVGKFLTTSNDYFFAPAAPIIYGSILLLVLLWLLVRRQRGTTYDATQAAIEALSAAVDGRLTQADRTDVIGQLHQAESAAPDPAGADAIADAVVNTLRLTAIDARLADEGWVARGDARRLLERILPTRVERWFIIIGLLLVAVGAVVSALVMLAAATGELDSVETLAAESGRLERPTEPIWVLLLLGINIAVGVGAVAALYLIRRGRTLPAMNAALATTLVSLVAGGLVGFYAVQLAALASTLQVLLLLALVIDQSIRLRRAASKADVNVGAAAG
jgi:hypothetical protein